MRKSNRFYLYHSLHSDTFQIMTVKQEHRGEINWKEKYKDMLEFDKRLFSMKQGEKENIFSELIILKESLNLDIQGIYRIISLASECNPRLLSDYWMLFQKIYEKFEIRPNMNYLEPAIRILCHKEYNLKTQSKSKIPKYYENFENQSIDDIINIYPEKFIMHSILHDDLESFMKSNFDKNAIINDHDIGSWCCYYGAVRCFKFLISNGVQITKEFLDNSFVGKNKEIIEECLSKCQPDEFTMKQCIKAHNNEYVFAFNKNYNIDIPIAKVIKFLNFPIFIEFFSHFDVNDTFVKSSIFGIPSLIDDLMKLGAEIDYIDGNGKTCLKNAAKFDNSETAEKLIQYGANIEITKNDVWTPLMIAAGNNSTETARKLIEANAKTEATNKGGWTALMRAAMFNSIETAILLIESGANMEAKDKYGWTSLMIAAANNNAEILSVLIAYGADIEAKDKNGKTSLIHAAKSDNAEIFGKLIELGADIETVDEDGWNAQMYADSFSCTNVRNKLSELMPEIDTYESYLPARPESYSCKKPYERMFVFSPNQVIIDDDRRSASE